MMHPSVYMNRVFRRQPGLLVLLLAIFIAPGLVQAQNACRLADPNSLGEFVSEICWFQFGDVDTDLPSGTIDQPFSFDLPDGSSIELDLSVTGGGGQTNPRLTVFEAPTWTGSNFSGSSDFYTILTPNAAALHSPDGRGHQVVLTLSNVTLLRPDGTEVTDLPYQLIVADAERLNSNPEYLDFGVISGGSEWDLLEWLGNAPAGAVSMGTPSSLDPGVASACDEATFVDCLRFKGETASSDANAPVLATSRDITSGDPFNIMGQIHSQAGQGFALGLRWGSVRLRKMLPEGRVDASDQFLYRIENVIGATVQVGETTGTGDEYPFVGTMAMPGNYLTLIEEMAPGSASTLDQYESHIVCIDQYGEGDVIVDEAYDSDNPPEITTTHLGDGIDCTITNTPLTVSMAFEKSADPMSYSQVGDTIEYSFTVTNNGTVDLSNVAVDDPLLGGAVACAPTTLLPTESATCGPVVYTVTQDDIDNGEIFNIATATALDPDDEPVSEEDEVTVPGPNHLPALEVVKMLTDAPTPITAGSVLEFTVTLTNTGNVTLFDVDVNDPLLAPNSTTCASVAPLDTCELVGEYTVTQGDMDAGEFLNFASGNGTPPSTIDDPDPEPIEDDDELTTPLPQDPGMMIEKVISDLPDPVVPGAVIEYTITATNTGNVTLDPVIVEDTLISPSEITCNNVAPGGTCVLVGTYELTQQDFNDGVVFNAATGSGTPPTGDPLVDDDEISLPLTQSPAMELVKSANPEDFAEVGDIIDYSFTVENTGNVTLTDVSVDDPMLGGAVACTPTTLDPGETANCGPVSYTVTQSDIDNGSIVNAATAAATDPSDTPVGDDDELDVPGPAHAPALELTKALTDSPQPIVVGSILEYTITATNIGNVTLDPVVVEDPLISPSDITCNNVPPGGTCELLGTYEVTQSDVNNGQVDNTATGAGTPPSTPQDPDPDPVEDDDQVSTPIDGDGALVLVKSADPANYGQVGDIIDYSFTVENTGSVTLTDVSVDDPMLGGAVACTPTTLDPGETANCGPVPYTVTQEDVDNGEVINFATATALDPDQNPLDGEDDLTVPGPDSDPGIQLLKEAELIDDNGNGFADPGEVIEYTLTATNTGNVTLLGVAITDDLISPLDCTPIQPATLAPGEMLVCTGSYTVTQDDADAGTPVINQATAEGTPPATPDDPDPEPVEDDDSTSTPVTLVPELTLLKEAELDDTNGNGSADAGEVIEYTLTATNTGNLLLEGVEIEDPMLDNLDCVPDQPATLDVGEALICTGSYTVTQADVDAGGTIANHATVTAPDPTDPDCSPGGDPDACDMIEDDDEEEVPLSEHDPSLVLIKSADPMSYSQVGDVVSYSFTLENTGNVTLFDVMVNDPMLGGDIACAPDELTPGETASCGPVAYTVTQSDIDHGQIINLATGSGTPPATDQNPDPDPVSDEDEVTVPGPAGSPGLDVVKSMTDAPDPIVVGSVLTYTVTATNTGTVSLSDVVVEDTLVTPSSATCPTLAVGESCVLEGIYTVTQSDIDNGEVVNVGSASGNPPGGEPPVEDEDDVTTPIVQTPLLGLVKEAELIDENDNGSADAGEVIEYTLTATNTGNVTLTDVTIDDPMIGVLSCTPAQPATLPPAGMLVCTGTYVVTQADVDSGEPILNVATVSSPDPIEPSNPPLQDEDNVATPVTSGVDVPAPLAVPLLSPYSLTLLALLIMLIGGTSVRMRVR